MHVPDGLFHALRLIEEDQLETGEIPNYRKLDNEVWEYRFSPLASAWVADSLASFDPLSHWFDPLALEQAGQSGRFEAGRHASRIRRQIQRFLAWQQSADGGWRFSGRGSPLPADRDTTACCALALLDRISGANEAGAGRVNRALRRVRESAAVREEQNAPGMWVADANILRLAVLCGSEAEPLALQLLRRLQEANGTPRSIALWFALGRLWRQSALNLLEPVIGRWADAVVSMQNPDGSFGGPLDTAMGLIALLDLGYAGPAVSGAAEWLSASMNSFRAPPEIEGFRGDLCGSPSVTTALAIGALARAS